MASRSFDPSLHQGNGGQYVFTDELVLAVNTALAVRRPLLVRGPPGSGKSALGRAIAVQLGWRREDATVSLVPE